MFVEVVDEVLLALQLPLQLLRVHLAERALLGRLVGVLLHVLYR